MLNDNDKIREEREKSRRLRDKYIGIGKTGGSGYAGDSYSSGGGYNSSAPGDRARYNYNNSYDSPTAAASKSTEVVTSDDSDEEEVSISSHFFIEDEITRLIVGPLIKTIYI